LSHLVAIKQKYNKTVFEYLRRFRILGIDVMA
jgi:hypothetical protein